MPRLHARPAAPRLPRRPRGADRGPLGADDRRHPVGRLLHGDRRRRRRRDLLGPRGRRALTFAAFGDHGTREFFTHVRFHKHDDDTDRGPPARRAVRPLPRGGDGRARGRPPAALAITSLAEESRPPAATRRPALALFARRCSLRQARCALRPRAPVNGAARGGGAGAGGAAAVLGRSRRGAIDVDPDIWAKANASRGRPPTRHPPFHRRAVRQRDEHSADARAGRHALRGDGRTATAAPAGTSARTPTRRARRRACPGAGRGPCKPSPARTIASAPPAPMPASSHWKSVPVLVETAGGDGSGCGFSARGRLGAGGRRRRRDRVLLVGAATSAPAVTSPRRYGQVGARRLRVAPDASRAGTASAASARRRARRTSPSSPGA